jgi:hypothetical protein
MDVVVGSLWWQARFPAQGLGEVPRLRPGHGARHAFFRLDDDGPTITLPRRYRTTGVVLHELCHWALQHDDDLPNHGRTFARLLLDATNEFGGGRRGESLAENYAQHGVRVGHGPRTGPDGRLRYGWDERLRLGKGRLLDVHHHCGHGVEAGSTCTRGRFEGWGRNGSSVRLHVGNDRVALPAASVWDVRPVTGSASICATVSQAGTHR